MPSNARDLAVYVHWPFCLSKCPYCDFNSHVTETLDHVQWRDARISELDHYAAQLPKRNVASIFFGGGTPSLMAPATTAALIETVGKHWTTDKNLEITLEANPTSVESAKFKEFRAAGVNRVSIGVQALDEDALQFLGRRHNSSEAIEAVTIAVEIFERVSLDLIYARPGQTMHAWQRELNRALDMATSHLSLYQLSIERGTPFYTAERRGEFRIPNEDLASDLYEMTQSICEERGLAAYEISNHSTPGNECRHNLGYWTGQDYVGIGPGAHGRISVDQTIYATEQTPRPDLWLAAIARDGHVTRHRKALKGLTRIEEVLMMGLRLREGLTRKDFHLATSQQFEDVLEPRRLRPLINANYLQLDKLGLRTTRAGRIRLNSILTALLA